MSIEPYSETAAATAASTWTRSVTSVATNSPPIAFGHRAACGLVEFGDHHPGTLVGEPPGDALTDPGAGAGDQRDPAGQRAAHRCHPVGKQLSGFGFAVQRAGGALGDLPAAVGAAQPEVVRTGSGRR